MGQISWVPIAQEPKAEDAPQTGSDPVSTKPAEKLFDNAPQKGGEALDQFGKAK